MLLSAIALSLLLKQAQDPALGTKVTFTSPGADASKIVEGLAKASGVPLFAPKAFHADILVVRLKDAPLKDVMDRIASVTASEWQKTGERYELVRSREKTRDEERAELAAELEIYQRAIEKQRKRSSSLEAWNEQTAKSLAISLVEAQKSMSPERFDNNAWQRLQALDERAPGGRAVSRVVAALEAKDLVGLPYDYRIVFSDQPTSLQRPLPGSVLNALKESAAEQNLWAEIAERHIPEPQGGYYSAAMWLRKSLQDGRGKTLLAVTKSRYAGGISVSVELMIANRKGVIAIRGNQALSAVDYREYVQPKPEPGEEPIEPSPLGKVYLSRFTPDNMAEPKFVPLPADLLDKVLNPERFDPITLTVGPVLIGIAEKKNLNMVALTSDDTYGVGLYAGIQKMTPSMLAATGKYGGFVYKEEAGWLNFRPTFPGASRGMREDRAAIGAFLRSVQKNGRMALDDLAAYAATTTGEMYSAMGYQMAMLLTPNGGDAYFDATILRFYGSLQPVQRQVMARERGIAVSSLTPAQGELVNRMIFGNSGDLQLKQPMDSQNQDAWEAFYNGLGREPTELFARGLPPSSTIKLLDDSGPVIMSRPQLNSNGIVYGTYPLTADDAAQRLYAKERPGIFPWIEQEPDWEGRKFSIGKRRLLNFSFDFGNLASMNKQLQDTEYDGSGAVSFDQLPEKFRKEVQQKLEEMRKNYANVKPGDFGGGGVKAVPPPLRR